MADTTARRLIALLGRLTPDSTLRISDLAEQIGVTEAQLAADLLTLATCGVAPYQPGDLMPLIVEDGIVHVFGELPAVPGGVRLSAAEARALAGALQAAGFPADDELTLRLLDASASVHFDATEIEHTVRTATAVHAGDVYLTLSASMETCEVVRIEYLKSGADEGSSREIEPVSLFAERSAWYVTAWCRKSGAWRTFRLDRIRAAGLTGERFDPSRRADTPSGGTAIRLDGLPVATLRFEPGADFTEREWPGGRVTATGDDGTLTVSLPFGGTDWIARRVVARLGEVEAVAPDEVRAAVRELAASERERLT